MSKIARLTSMQWYLNLQRQTNAHLLLLHPDHEPETRQARIYQLGEYALLTTELEDHLHNLTGMATACQYGLADTIPEGQDPATYDPYAVLAAHLGGPGGSWRQPVGQLSPLLLAYIDSLPELEREGTAAVLEHHPDALWGYTDEGTLRPVPAEEAANEPERAFLHQAGQNFFALTYAAELADAATLVAERGSLLGIWSLVQ